MSFPERENIDKWFFDFYEGNLSENQKSMLFAFLEDHPDLIEDFEAWEETKLAPQEINNFQFDRINQLQRKESQRSPRLAFLFIGMVMCSLIFIGRKDNSQTNQNFTSGLVAENVESNTVSIKNGHESPIEQVVSEKNSLTAKTTQRIEIESNSPATEDFTNSSTRVTTRNNQKLNKLYGTPIEQFNRYNNSLATLPLASSNVDEITTESILKENDFEKMPVKSLSSISLSTTDFDFENNAFEIGELSTSSGDQQGLDLKVKLPKWIKNIGNRDIGLNYIPDQLYALPELSQTDVQFSNVGAVSQVRVMTSSIGRWLEKPENQLISNQITIDGYSRATRLGIGFQMNYDRFGNGIFSNYDAALSVSPKIAMTRKISFEPAMRIRFGNYQLNPAKIESYNNSQIEFQTGNIQTVSFDTLLQPGQNLLYQDIDLGFTINSSKYYLGIQGTNLSRHFNDIFSNTENTYERASVAFSAIAGTQFLSNNQKLSFAPYVFVKNEHAQWKQFVGFNSYLHGLSIGGSYSNDHMFSALLGYSGQKFSIHALSSLQRTDNGSINFIHQLGMRFNNLTSKKERRYITL